MDGYRRTLSKYGGGGETMDYDLHYKLKRGNLKAFRELYTLDLRRLWFICYHITKDVKKAAPLLIHSWKSAIDKVVASDAPPEESFGVLAAAEIFKAARKGVEGDADYGAIAVPVIPKEYAAFVNGIKRLAYEDRYMYLLTAFGGLNAGMVAGLMGTPLEQTRGRLASLSAKAQDTPEIKELGFALSVRLSTEFKSPDGRPFLRINLPQFLITTLEHDYQCLMREQGKSTALSKAGKESYKMKTTAKPTQKTPAKKRGFQYTKPIVITAVCLAAVLSAAIILPKLLGSNGDATRIVTYHVDEVTYGNVTQTISGSGTLTPVTKETLTATKGGEVEKVNFTVGDEVTKDAVIAVVNGEEITAPCDGILLEFPLAAGDEVAAGGSVAMIMGKDGFTMGIAVDETEISSVALDQEVTFTIDALSEEYTGSVAAISYNGSSSGGTVAFQITASVDDVEGVYPGMSASAEIVIEDSGEGLLVPVDAVGTSGDENYVYLAPSGSEAGAVYEDGEIDVNDLTKVAVETGMSDGTYMIVESDEITEGSLIVVTQVTSTLTGSDEEGGGGGFGGMGGFPGGMDFGDFDFENFDPSQMPQGGNFPNFGG